MPSATCVKCENAGVRRLWLGADLVTEAVYRAREQAAKEKLQALALDQSWAAREIGRSVQMVNEVLNGKDPVPKKRAGTLALIEVLLRQVEAGEVVPG